MLNELISAAYLVRSETLGDFGIVTDMKQQSIGLVSLIVRVYDEALEFFVGVLGFKLLQDTYVPQQDERWVV